MPRTLYASGPEVQTKKVLRLRGGFPRRFSRLPDAPSEHRRRATSPTLARQAGSPGPVTSQRLPRLRVADWTGSRPHPTRLILSAAIPSRIRRRDPERSPHVAKYAMPFQEEKKKQRARGGERRV